MKPKIPCLKFWKTLFAKIGNTQNFIYEIEKNGANSETRDFKDSEFAQIHRIHFEYIEYIVKQNDKIC